MLTGEHLTVITNRHCLLTIRHNLRGFAWTMSVNAQINSVKQALRDPYLTGEEVEVPGFSNFPERHSGEGIQQEPPSKPLICKHCVLMFDRHISPFIYPFFN